MYEPQFLKTLIFPGPFNSYKIEWILAFKIPLFLSSLMVVPSSSVNMEHMLTHMFENDV